VIDRTLDCPVDREWGAVVSYLIPGITYVRVTGLIPVVSVYVIFVAPSAVVIGALAVRLYRHSETDFGSGTASEGPGSEPSDGRRHADLVRPFCLVLAVLSVSAFAYTPFILDGPSELDFGFATAIVVSLPWSVFALRYVGREYLVTRLRIALVSALVLAITVVISIPVLPGFSQESVPESILLVASFLSLGIVAIVFVVGGLVLLTTYRHGGLSLASGAVAVFPVGSLFFIAQLTRPDAPAFSTATLTITYVALAMIIPVSVTRYNVLSVRPGTGTLGERRLVEEMDEAVFVVARRGDVARANETAEELFGDDIEGEPFADVLDCRVTDLAERDTIEWWTERGRKLFDPRVSTLTDSRDRTLGHTVTLLDVTEREIRQQRIQVLNRILRHNIRNDLDVIRARAEAATDDDRSVEDQTDTILDVAEGLEGLSADARRIEKLIRRSRETETAVDLAAVVDRVVDTAIDPSPPGADVTVDVPSARVRLNEGLFRFALGNLLGNALEHTDSPDPRIEIRGRVTDAGIQVVVADDGPGIPESERAVLEAGGEDPLAHATSLGLWGANWAVQTLGGDLFLGSSDLGGTMARIDLPATRLASGDD
jgi:signal transduction histidine kinase